MGLWGGISYGVLINIECHLRGFLFGEVGCVFDMGGDKLGVGEVLGQSVLDGVGDLVDVGGVEQSAELSNDFRNRGGVGTCHTSAARHGFERS